MTDNFNINRIDAINIRCHQSLQFKCTIVIALFNEFYCSGRYIMVEWKCHKKQCFCIKQWLRCYIYSYLLKYILIFFYFNEWDTTHKKLVVWGIQFIKIRFNHIFSHFYLTKEKAINLKLFLCVIDHKMRRKIIFFVFVTSKGFSFVQPEVIFIEMYTA